MAADPKTILTILVIAKWLVEEIAVMAKQQGLTDADLDAADINRAEAIDAFKKAAGIE